MAKNIQSLTFKANLENFSLPYFHIHIEIPPQPTYILLANYVFVIIYLLLFFPGYEKIISRIF